MECQYRSADGRLIFKIDGGNQKEIFEGIADLQEIFEADRQCGMPDCKSNNIRFRVRTVSKGNKTFKYYELHCHACNARFCFGQVNDDPKLFPKRKDESGQYLPNRGWSKYVPKDE